MDKLLLHSCCAPCSVYCVDTLRADGIEPTSLWFNPNIHPWTEYDARRRTLLEYGEKEHVEVHILEDYGLRDFVRAVSADIDHRCAHCYTIRLGTAAKYAADHGYDAFTSSLLISPYQNHELLKAVGETMGRKYGVKFYYRDFRPGFREGQAKAREMGLKKVYCHILLDGRDVPATSALDYVDQLETVLAELNDAEHEYKIASGGGARTCRPRAVSSPPRGKPLRRTAPKIPA